MRTLIITQALRTNYGGLLQAYALQKTIKDLGHDVVTDKKEYKAPKLSFQILYTLYRIIRGGIFRNEKYRPVFPRMLSKSRYSVIAKNTEQFTNQHINTTNFLKKNNTPSSKEIDKYDAFIVGSDQVWRKKYSDLKTYYFSFLH
ncbi:MAG: polysaccharide pyruvyl transferase family protein, partial [Draconibacterium sp.]